MEKIIVRGGKRLEGTVKVEGAKNAVLPILAATILASVGESKLTNVPTLSDVFTINEVLHHLNLDINFSEKNKEVVVNATHELNFEAPFEYVSKMRASIVVMGPLLARLGHAKVALPGGCAIGTRPIDLHLKGFEAMGARVHIENGFIEAFADELKGARIYLDFPSVGATQNIMMAATLAKGTTVIENVAREPEIVDLANFLNRMGAKVIGAGTETIRIEGVEVLTGTEHGIIPDRIEAGTFMVAAAMTKGNIFIEDAVAEHNKPLISKLKEMNVSITEEENGMRVIGPEKLKATDVKTMPHPGFPTDMQAQMTAVQLLAEGTSTMTETVFENRYMHMEELRRMNANFKVEGPSLVMYGPTKLQGAEVAATDLRAAAALILSGLCAEGYTRVTHLEYLDRGYFEFHKKLQALGADVERVNEEENQLTEAELEKMFN
ncbi:MAG: UDP-N-acetylglucosamine 1-carboxyvinyltransferase [Carnobacterium sp.]|jgi:UDP-N-acetylglucosamine 1-carboxyvinyltransferase|uniref:UDP-N-acetylglucosamine 1-carboxyvinyltransferase n=2 Tax=Carnobacterium maltaromaticum TaxID=2751 RepID=K8E2M4_CARML|nr:MULTISPECIES: UDP-N-acetylglucosamine 1-carboxyvinyltransferase [Carnobacterium]AOA01244.1 UDP-N-acetylglucosamine 1-carboxyvinyltransferase [Carnobacterium maltaromaticum]KRN62970.1 UDP-N-acetylglucosamine 1-carboxyvinyltransferase [Carnobacterium maltaromaticum DSM 20342]MBC9789921.1 UDP-N-acetylglucosamine 1-carboxyvinyltransferase [Carnobacterium maltaromaticum]MBQ6484858.1 UDP-N-acetylglucosamine 1-carboxyvinyltransferase [Carnobacterium sp.]MCC4313056.1 UDP-N-acetylglucosamine 1-carbo